MLNLMDRFPQSSLWCVLARWFSMRCSIKPFTGERAPSRSDFNPEALAVSSFSREQHLEFDEPESVMENFAGWLEKNSIGRPICVSDNPAFDWQFINYYFHRFLGKNPSGFSARRIGDLNSGLVRDASKASERKKYRVTAHTHNPVMMRRVMPRL
jgi:hypothetical protein